LYGVFIQGNIFSPNLVAVSDLSLFFFHGQLTAFTLATHGPLAFSPGSTMGC
jgi:hypothetical protein